MADTERKKTCGYCKNYVPMQFSDMRGVCREIPGEKPGQLRGKKATYDMDASQCPKFDALESVVKFDISQGAGGTTDFTQLRSSDVFEATEEVKSDRLVWEKHSRDKQ